MKMAFAVVFSSRLMSIILSIISLKFLLRFFIVPAYGHTYEKRELNSEAGSKGPDQPAHLSILIRIYFYSLIYSTDSVSGQGRSRSDFAHAQV